MKITAAHGSGGRDSALLVEGIFGRHFANPVLDRLEDAAVLDNSAGRLALSTDSFVVSPLVFKGGDIGRLSVCGTANDLLMAGAEPRYLACGFILEEGLDTGLLDSIAASMAREAKAAGLVIVAGDTKVAGDGGGLYINTTGLGFVPEGRLLAAASCEPGDAILLSGRLGDHHACVLSARMGIENGIESDCACLGDVTAALFGAGVRVRAMRDVTRGGLGTILNELAAGAGRRMEISEDLIPVGEPVRAFCGIMGLDPLYMGNEGKMVAIVAGDDADRALAAARGTEHGAEAAIIGRVAEGGGDGGRARVTMRTRIGGTRRVDVLYGEGLPRIC
ncbi:MAG: hydrogenase expression/formation protein HypE [Clostridiales Family XIII bacterium]|jgi:hydrogenase expression/formation protein HypE|nr:hydrogenase expression/formation protein HypE [Clostridiales Family XIII bacterium]